VGKAKPGMTGKNNEFKKDRRKNCMSKEVMKRKVRKEKRIK
jgi:hypothetical protein